MEEDEGVPKKKKRVSKSPKKAAPPNKKSKPAPAPKLEDPKSKGEVTPSGKAKPPTSGKVGGPADIPKSGSSDPNVIRQANDFFDRMGLNSMPDAGEMRAGGAGVPPTDPTLPKPASDNLPDIIRTNLVRTDFDGAPPGWEPNWKQVKDLPRMFQTAIQQLAKAVFSLFTDVPVGEIWHMSTPAGDSTQDLNLMGQWIQQNGIRDDAMRLQMEEAIPGYHGDILVYNTVGYTFVLVHDFAGHYIYAWPGGRGVHVGGNNVPQLEGKKVSTKALVEYLIEGDAAVFAAPKPPKAGPLDGAATKLNALIEKLRPYIQDLPTFHAIENHLIRLVANNAVVKPYTNTGRSDSQIQKKQAADMKAGEAAANKRSQDALKIIRGYIRLRDALKQRGMEDLGAHIESIKLMKTRPEFNHDYIDAIFHP